VYQLLDQGVSGRVQGRSLAASMQFGRDVPRRAVPTQQLLDERETDAEKVRQRALGAEPALARMQNLLP
jgi:hypothetical protein